MIVGRVLVSGFIDIINSIIYKQFTHLIINN